MNEHDTLDAQWHQKQQEEEQMWREHEKQLRELEDMLSKTKHGWRGMRRVSDDTNNQN